MWETGTLLLYVAALSFGIHQHVPWADESQAWMLAHEVPLGHLLSQSLHYEGTPGLWHTLLKLLQVFHISLTGMRWIAGGIAAASTAVLLAYAPFPRIVRVLLPFTFFLAYQDAVVARSYTLYAVMAFAAAALLRSTRYRPVLLALLLGLMANISVHASIASGGMAMAALLLWRKRVPSGTGWRTAGAILLLLAFWLGAICSMAPAHDIDYVAGNNVQRSIAQIEQQFGIKAKVPAPLSQAQMANLPPTLPAVHLRNTWQGIWNRLARLLSVITYPLSVYRSLALLLVALVVLQACLSPRSASRRATTAASERQLGSPGLLPYLLMVATFTSVYLAPRHVGMVFTTFVVTAWLTWPAERSLAGPRLLVHHATTFVFTLILLIQISWTYHALRLEHMSPYSPDLETATYLKQQGVGAPDANKRLAAFYYYSIGPLAYFDHNIYINQPPHRYWLWSTSMRTYGTVQEALAQHPDFVVIGGYESGHDAEITRDWLPGTPSQPGVVRGDGFFIGDFFRHHGYHDTHVFCGHSWMRSTYAERICLTVLEPVK